MRKWFAALGLGLGLGASIRTMPLAAQPQFPPPGPSEDELAERGRQYLVVGAGDMLYAFTLPQ